MLTVDETLHSLRLTVVMFITTPYVHLSNRISVYMSYD